MGEIIFSFFVGGWMVLTGIFLNWWLFKEERHSQQKKSMKEAN